MIEDRKSESGLHFRLLLREDAFAMMSWRYPPPCSAYDLDCQDPAILDALLKPENNYHAILRDGDMAGFSAGARMPACLAGRTIQAQSTWAWACGLILPAVAKVSFFFERFSPASNNSFQKQCCAPPYSRGISAPSAYA